MGESHDERRLREMDHNMALANFAFLGTSEVGDVAEDRDAWLWCCGLPAPEFNKTFPKTPIRDLDACLERAAAFFDPRGLPWRLTQRREVLAGHAAALREKGFEEVNSEPLMVMETLPEIPPPPAGLEVREVADAGSLEHFRATTFEGFGLPEQLASKFVTAGFGDLPHVRLLVGEWEGRPACTSAVVMSGDQIGVYFVATLDAFRGRGLGAAVTWAAIEKGRELGGTWASLQASKLGHPVYERMGFAMPTEYVHLQRPEQDDSDR